LRNTTLAVKMDHLGASEIYLDGNLVRRFGTVGANQEEEETFVSRDRVLAGLHLDGKAEHLLAVRYSFQNAETAQHIGGGHAGFRLTLLELNPSLWAEARGSVWIYVPASAAVGVVTIVSLLHLGMFAFRSSGKANLYFGVSAAFDTCYVASHLIRVSVFLTADQRFWVDSAAALSGGLFGFFFLLASYSVFCSRIPRQSWAFASATVLFCGLLIYQRRYEAVLAMAFVGAVSLELIRMSVRAIRWGQEGARIFAAGAAATALAYVVYYATTLGWVPRYDLQLVHASLAYNLALPVSMSLLLARRFAHTYRREAQLEGELQTAHQMQMGLMPEDNPTAEGVDVSGRCIPANHVGGDLFQYFQQEGRLNTAIADVTGHAMDAAILVVMFSGVLDRQMETGEGIRATVNHLNRSMCRNLDDRRFVCFTIAEMDLVASSLRLSNAGCPYPYHYQAASRQVVELDVSGYPLGIRPDTEYQVLDVRLEPGDRVVFCSDGIVEANNAADEQFGYERTAEAIRKACVEDLSAEATINRLLDEVASFRAAAPQSDDMACVVLRVEGGRA